MRHKTYGWCFGYHFFMTSTEVHLCFSLNSLVSLESGMVQPLHHGNAAFGDFRAMFTSQFKSVFHLWIACSKSFKAAATDTFCVNCTIKLIILSKMWKKSSFWVECTAKIGHHLPCIRIRACSPFYDLFNIIYFEIKRNGSRLRFFSLQFHLPVVVFFKWIILRLK